MSSWCQANRMLFFLTKLCPQKQRQRRWCDSLFQTKSHTRTTKILSKAQTSSLSSTLLTQVMLCRYCKDFANKSKVLKRLCFSSLKIGDLNGWSLVLKMKKLLNFWTMRMATKWSIVIPIATCLLTRSNSQKWWSTPKSIARTPLRLFLLLSNCPIKMTRPVFMNTCPNSQMPLLSLSPKSVHKAMVFAFSKQWRTFPTEWLIRSCSFKDT